MKKKHILALTFLCLLIGQSSFGQSNGGDYDNYGDENPYAILDALVAGLTRVNDDIVVYENPQEYIDAINNDNDFTNDFEDLNGDGYVNTNDDFAFQYTVRALDLPTTISDNELRDILAATVQLREVVVTRNRTSTATDYFRDFLEIAPVLGPLLQSSDELEQGNYGKAALFFAIATADLYTLGAASEFSLGIRGAIIAEELVVREIPVVRDPAKELLEKIIRWTDETTHQFKWPANNGFKGVINDIEIPIKSTIDRYGLSSGSFASPVGTSWGERALAPGSSLDLHTYEVLKPLPAKYGEVAAWFDEIGGGIQYQFDKSIDQLINEGFLKEIF
jgi:chorismate mutase